MASISIPNTSDAAQVQRRADAAPDLIRQTRAMSPAERRSAIYSDPEAVEMAVAMAVDAIRRDDPQSAAATFSVSIARPEQKPWWWEHAPLFHPESLRYPIIRAKVEGIARNIAANGLKHPIIRHPDGRILDGRVRYLACVMAGVEPRYEQWDGAAGTEREYVTSVNLYRRHLNKTQLALIVAEYAQELAAEAQGRSLANLKRGDARADAAPSGIGRSTDRAVAVFGGVVSARSTAYAADFLKRAARELVDAVRDNDDEISLKGVALLARMDHETQTNIARGGPDIIREKIRDLKKDQRSLRSLNRPDVTTQVDFFPQLPIVEAAALLPRDEAAKVIEFQLNRHAARYKRLAEVVTKTMAQTDRDQVPGDIRDRLLAVLLKAAAKVAGRSLDDEDFRDAVRAAMAITDAKAARTGKV